MRCWPVAEWPVKDRAAWAAALREGTPFDPGGIAARWAPATVGMTENGYRGWLAWLDANGMLDPGASPGQRVTEERVTAYADNMTATVAPFSVQGRIRQLGNALRAMAPRGDWGWILRGANRLCARATPVRDKRARLQMPNLLEDLGLKVMAGVEASTEVRPMWRAADYRDGLIIALLAHRPLRARNLTMIECGRHLVWESGVWRLVFTTDETKTREPMTNHSRSSWFRTWKPTSLCTVRSCSTLGGGTDDHRRKHCGYRAWVVR